MIPKDRNERAIVPAQALLYLYQPVARSACLACMREGPTPRIAAISSRGDKCSGNVDETIQCLSMRVCLRVCICVHIYVCIYIYICLYLYICVYIHVCVPIYLSVCLPVRLSTCLYVYIYTVYICMYIHIRASTYTCTHVRRLWGLSSVMSARHACALGKRSLSPRRTVLDKKEKKDRCNRSYRLSAKKAHVN